MKQLIAFLISLQIAQAPSLVLAENMPSARSLEAPLSSEAPLMYTDTQSFQLPDGKTYVSENTVVVAETEEQMAIAEDWFVENVQTASRGNIPYRVVSLYTEGDPETAAANALSLKLPKEARSASSTIHKSLLTRIKRAVSRTKNKIETSLSSWVEKRPNQFKKVFALTRGGLNGAFSSYVFNYFFLDGAIPTWLALSAGLTMGAISGTINYFSDSYAHWMDQKADLSTLKLVQKFFPFVSDEKINEMKSLSKWAGLEVSFLAIPILFFQYLPGLLDMGDGYAFASSWMTGLFALSMSFVTGMFAQYPWEKGISRAHTSDSEYAPDHISKNWIKFKTALTYVLISGLQVTITSLSLGDYKVSSYLALGAMGAAGMYYRYKVMERTRLREAENVLKKSTKNCAELISFLFIDKTPNPLSWVS